jgi:hypothetical protein
MAEIFRGTNGLIFILPDNESDKQRIQLKCGECPFSDVLCSKMYAYGAAFLKDEPTDLNKFLQQAGCTPKNKTVNQEED